MENKSHLLYISVELAKYNSVFVNSSAVKTCNVLKQCTLLYFFHPTLDITVS